MATETDTIRPLITDIKLLNENDIIRSYHTENVSQTEFLLTENSAIITTEDNLGLIV